MSLGFAKGLDFDSFCHVVKTMKLVAFKNGQRFEGEIPLEMFNVPFYKFQMELPREVENSTNTN